MLCSKVSLDNWDPHVLRNSKVFGERGDLLKSAPPLPTKIQNSAVGDKVIQNSTTRPFRYILFLPLHTFKWNNPNSNSNAEVHPLEKIQFDTHLRQCLRCILYYLYCVKSSAVREFQFNFWYWTTSRQSKGFRNYHLVEIYVILKVWCITFFTACSGFGHRNWNCDCNVYWPQPMVWNYKYIKPTLH